MRNIEIDEDLYQYIASKTEVIGESASDILRRLLGLKKDEDTFTAVAQQANDIAATDLASPETIQTPAEQSSEVEQEVATQKPAIDSHLTLPRKRKSKKKATQSKRQLSDNVPPVEELVTRITLEQAEQFVGQATSSEELQQCGSSAKRFLVILGMLSKQHGESFAVVEHVQGAERLYFAKQQSVLEAAGSSTNPRHIPHSDYWVVTNSNTERKRSMVSKVCKFLGYTQAHIDAICALI